MKLQLLRRGGLFGLFVASVLFATGCSQQAGDTTDDAAPGSQASHDDESHQPEGGDDHSGWWCVEHGVPESECSRCDSSLIAQFKEKGDWCKEHDRPESQCFICDPSRAEQFAARYEAKFGKKPPAPTE